MDTKDNKVSAEKIVEKKTVADKIWEEIKGIELAMFSLPDQTVEKYCQQIKIEPSKLYLIFTAQAVIPALEEAVGSKFNVDLAQKYLIISPK